MGDATKHLAFFNYLIETCNSLIAHLCMTTIHLQSVGGIQIDCRASFLYVEYFITRQLLNSEKITDSRVYTDGMPMMLYGA